VLVGDFDSAQAVALAKRYFGRIPRGPEPPQVITEEPEPIAERRFNAEAETNPRVQVRYHTVAIGHTDEAALDVLAGILSGKSGRLYKRLITQEDAAIGEPTAYNQSRKYAGYMEFYVTVKEGRQPEEVERFVLEEIDKLREGEIAEHELQRVKNQVLAGSIRRLKSNIGLMFQLGLYDTWLDWRYINESPQRMLQVTADDVRRVVSKYLDPKTRTVAIYRTKKGAVRAEDPDVTALLADLPPEQVERTKAMIAQFKESTDLGRLESMLAMMQQGMASDQIPDEQRALYEYMVKVIEARVAELKAANKESD